MKAVNINIAMFFLLLLSSSTLQEGGCTEGLCTFCIAVSNGNLSCAECQNSYPRLITGTTDQYECIVDPSIQIENCKIMDTDSKCTRCDDGRALSVDRLSCSEEIDQEGCQVLNKINMSGEIVNRCQQCYIGYVLNVFEDTCTAISGEFIPENCEAISSLSFLVACIRCQEGYMVQGITCTKDTGFTGCRLF